MAFNENSVSQEERDRVTVTLLNQEEWDGIPKIHEMVVSSAGRIMRPFLYYGVTGLNPNDTYMIKLDVVPANNKIYNFNRYWGNYIHSDGYHNFWNTEPAPHTGVTRTGERWMDSPFTFNTIKLTTSAVPRSIRDITVHLKCLCFPVLEIHKREDAEWKIVCVRIFPNTSFVPVSRLNRPKVPRRPLRMPVAGENADED